MIKRIFNLGVITILGYFLVSCTGTVKDKNYLEEGKELAAVSFKTLSGQLQGALKEGGVQNAVQYCNFMANPLVDSLSKKYNAEIRRTTFQTRNKDNKPRDYEKDVLIKYMQSHKNKEELSPEIVKLEDGKTAFFSPIVIQNGLCLTCHGNPGGTIADEDYAFIQSLYPDDEAVGYQLGDFRGMWSITFPR
jgi:hypothetical protein